MKRNILRVAAVLALVSVPMTAAGGNPWAEQLRQADKLFAAGDYQNARKALVEVTGLLHGQPPSDPRVVMTWTRLGSVEVNLGNLREGESAYLRALNGCR